MTPGRAPSTTCLATLQAIEDVPPRQAGRLSVRLPALAGAHEPDEQDKRQSPWMLPGVESRPAGTVSPVAHISGHVRIAAPIERVFDTAADSRNEPSFNPAMSDVELLTPPPIGLGAQFRARMGKTGMVMLVELTEFDRPHRLGSRTTSSMMETSGALTFTADNDGTIMSWGWQVRPKGWLRTLGPLAGPLGGRMERRIWTGLKHMLENDGGARSS